jgi:hypothetical protein
MSKRNRARRDERQPNPQPIRLTERDLNIIKAVYEYRVLTTQQLQSLFFPSMHQAYNRLAALYHHGFLDRSFMGVYTDMMNTPILYVLDRKGAELLQAHYGADVAWNSSHKQVSIQFLDHTLAINTVRIAVSQACEALPDCELIEWRSESDLKGDYDRVTIQTTSGKSKSVSLIPDSYFVLQTPLGNAHFFLELDRGTMTSKRFKQKIFAYMQYYKTGKYQNRFQTKSLRILTVTTSQARADNLKVATESAKGKQRFWFTILAHTTPDSILTAPIWQVAGKDGAYPLIEMTE